MNREITQDALASTLMSSVKSAYEFFYDEKISDSFMYGVSGHAFVINITNGLGPCAPYTWEMKQFGQLCQDYLGLNVFGKSNVVTTDTSLEEKKKATNEIKEILDKGNLVLLSSYEFQLITGYENNEFILTSPWDNVPSVTPNLACNTFAGMKEFFTYFEMSKTDKKPLGEGIKESLRYAKLLFEQPSSTPDSAMGVKAYDFWLEKINDENAIAHGNWWTSSVWSESREMASKYMVEIKKYFEQDEILDELSVKYVESSKLLSKISNREIQKEETITLIKKLKENETQIQIVLDNLFL